MTSSTPTLPTPTEPTPTSPRDGLVALLALLWRRRLVLLVVVLLVAATVGVGLTVSERTYSAQARVAVVPGETGPSGTEYEAMQRTIADLAVSRPVLSLVREDLQDRSLTALRDQVSSGAVTGTLLVQVSVDDPDPRRAAQIANAVTALLPQVDPSDGRVRYELTEPAAVPTAPSSPDVPVTVLASVVLAAGLAVAIAVAYDRVARTVDMPEDVAAAGTRVLGVVGAVGDLSALPAVDTGSERFADLRSLRVALEFASIDDPTRTLVVASADGGRANGWLAVNLAVALAGVGHRVLLVDADRTDADRHPVLAGDAGPGLYDVLSGEASLAEAVRPGPVNDVEVLGLGDADQAAPSLLEMRFRTLFEPGTHTGDAAREDVPHDVVVVSAPAVSESDDARVMAVDGGLLLTIGARRVKPAALSRALAGLRVGRSRVLGAVLLDAR